MVIFQLAMLNNQMVYIMVSWKLAVIIKINREISETSSRLRREDPGNLWNDNSVSHGHSFSTCWSTVISTKFAGRYTIIMIKNIWVWVNTYRYIFSGMNIHLPAILGFTRYQGFDPSPYIYICTIYVYHNCISIVITTEIIWIYTW